MKSKVLFVILFSCTTILAAPVKESSDEKRLHSEYTVLNDVDLEDKNLQMQLPFTNFVEKIGAAIRAAQLDFFEKIGNIIETEEFKLAVKELREIFETVYDEDYSIEAKDEDKKKIQNGLQKIADAFEKLIDKAIEAIEKSSDKKVASTEFVKQVKELKGKVKQIFIYH